MNDPYCNCPAYTERGKEIERLTADLTEAQQCFEERGELLGLYISDLAEARELLEEFSTTFFMTQEMRTKLDAVLSRTEGK